MGVLYKMIEELREKGYGEWKGACEIKIKCFLGVQQECRVREGG